MGPPFGRTYSYVMQWGANLVAELLFYVAVDGISVI